MNEYVMYFFGQCTWRPERVIVAFGGKDDGNEGESNSSVGTVVNESSR